MRTIILSTIVIGLVVGSFYWVWERNPRIAESISQYIDNSDFLTLEARYTPEQIMNSHRHELLGNNSRKFKNSSLKFHPYLLIEAKYTDPQRKTREGTLLWSLVDGEMVLNTETWEQTHGFQDALLVNASKNEFKILNALAKNGGSMSKQQLEKELNLQSKVITPWINSARSKHLIIQKGSQLYLHFQNPNILVRPQTKISQWLVTKPYSHAQRLTKRFSRKQVEGVAKAAFGDDFTIRSIKEVALPVYSIEVLNGDGSVHTSFWNALNGQKINPRSFAY